MSRSQTKRQRSKRLSSNPDFRHQVEVPMPSIDELQQQLYRVLEPGLMAPLRLWPGCPKFRDRILTLPVMMAIVVSLVCRKLSSLSEILKLAAEDAEGLLWAGQFKVSKQAVSQRLARLPVALFARLFEEALERLTRERQKKAPPLASLPAEWQPVSQRFTCLWIADGSTLEALKKRLDVWKDQTLALGGKMMVVVDAFIPVPQAAWYTADSQANDKTFFQKLLQRLPRGGLLIFDLGFFGFPGFDALTESGQYFLTRLREKTSYRVERVLSQGPRYRDQIIYLGKYRSNPCRHPVRQVSVLWGTTWYHYLTNVLDPEWLSAAQVCQLYRRRWRIEQAFLLTKRLLGLSYLWVGSLNGVQIQIYATWIFYAVLIDLCHQLAEVLQQPLDRISVEMVFRSLYYYSRKVLKDPHLELVAYLAQRAQFFGLIKALRKRHRQIDQRQQEIWAPP